MAKKTKNINIDPEILKIVEEAKNNECISLFARRLAAAYIAGRLGLSGVDYTLKHYITDMNTIADSWYYFAGIIHHAMKNKPRFNQ